MIDKGLSFSWVESTNLLLHLIVSSEFDVLDKLPLASVFEVFHVWAITVLLKVLGSGGEDSKTSSSQRKEHLLEDGVIKMVVGQNTRGSDDIESVL